MAPTTTTYYMSGANGATTAPLSTAKVREMMRRREPSTDLVDRSRSTSLTIERAEPKQQADDRSGVMYLEVQQLLREKFQVLLNFARRPMVGVVCFVVLVALFRFPLTALHATRALPSAFSGQSATEAFGATTIHSLERINGDLLSEEGTAALESSKLFLAALVQHSNNTMVHLEHVLFPAALEIKDGLQHCEPVLQLSSTLSGTATLLDDVSRTLQLLRTDLNNAHASTKEKRDKALDDLNTQLRNEKGSGAMPFRSTRAKSSTAFRSLYMHLKEYTGILDTATRELKSQLLDWEMALRGAARLREHIDRWMLDGTCNVDLADAFLEGVFDLLDLMSDSPETPPFQHRE